MSSRPVKVNLVDSDLIISLLKVPFSSRDDAAKNEILRNGRPTPKLSIDKALGDVNRYFQSSWYIRHKWLCASGKMSKLFCWPCLLLSKNKKYSPWSCDGFDDLKNATRGFIRHEASKEHMNSQLSLCSLTKQAMKCSEILNERSKFQILKYNKEVRKNREVFKVLIDITSLICKQNLIVKLPTDESGISVNYDCFKSFLNLSLMNNSIVKQHWDERRLLREDTRYIQPKLIECFEQRIRAFVENEVNKAPFFSCKLYETADSSGHTQCSVAVRLVDSSGFTREYFLGFHQFQGNVSSDRLCNVIFNALENFNYKERLVAVTYNGKSVLPRELKLTKEKLRKVAPLAVFTHSFNPCQTHVIDVLCSKIQLLEDFFNLLKGLPGIIHYVSQKLNCLGGLLNITMPTDNGDRWESNSKIITIALKNRARMIELFEQSLPFLDSEDKFLETQRYINHFKDCSFVFLLFVFRKVFKKTELLFKTLHDKSHNPQLCNDSVVECVYFMLEQKDEKVFKDLLERAETATGQTIPGENLLGKVSPLDCYKDTYFGVIDIITSELVEIQFPNPDEFKCLRLFDSSNFSKYEDYFPSGDSLSAISSFGQNLNKEKLRAELEVIYSQEQTHRFHDLRLNKLIQQMIKDDTKDILPEAFSFFTLAATIPESKAPVMGLTCLKRVKSFLQNKLTRHQLSLLAAVTIEKRTLERIEKDPEWHDGVIECFANKHKSPVKLLYK